MSDWFVVVIPSNHKNCFLGNDGAFIHYILPVLFLPNETWQSFLTLTLTGQYIIKNVVLLSAAWFIYVFSEN